MTKAAAIAALGFAPHSGWAAVVGLGGDEAHRRILIRERVEMTDPRDPGSKQPYHAVRGLPISQAARRLASYEATAELMAHEAIQRIAGRLSQSGHRVIGAGILESAGRKGSSLADTLASHALVHAADGDHFRNAIAAAATRCALTVSRVRARDVESEAAAVADRGLETLRRALQTLGRDVGPPWGADQKSAALLAWIVLTKESSGGRQT